MSLTKKARTDPEAPVEPRLFHIKITYCGRLAGDYIIQWCAKLFDMNEKILVVLEKGKGGGLHWHCQGTTTRSETWIKHHREKLCAKHSSTLEAKRQIAHGKTPAKHRLTSVSTQEVTQTGYQYMMKRGSQVIQQNKFTEEELEDLQAASEKHVEKMKRKVADHVKEAVDSGMLLFPRSIDEMPRFLSKAMMYVYDIMTEREEKTSTRHFKSDLLRSLAEQCKNEDQRTWLVHELFGIRHP